jgi:type IV pilus assembly protein PilY1
MTMHEAGGNMKTTLLTLMAAVLLGLSPTPGSAAAPVLSDYTSYPPFLNQSVPPIVMLAMSKDHRIFIKAYNDVVDLDGDGVLDTTYKDSIDYAGYFDPNKCYTYVTANSRFEPQSAATGTNNHYCSGKWSGNLMNWAVMARIDVMRQVLYGGRRSIDTSSTTVLSRTVMPQDAHSWAKVYSGSDISSLIPYGWTSVTFCNTNTASSQTSSLILVKNGSYPYAASTEVRQCVSQDNSGTALSPDYTLTADVLVCVSGLLESNCETYTDTGGTSHYKPTGLMQQLGINRQGTATTTDDVIYMKFGLISGSTGAHVGGGVVRSNIVDVNSEIDPATGMVAATSQIIKNIDQFVILQYSFSSGYYDGTGSTDKCNNPEPLVLSNNGICRSWGNPMGEMLYETIRFFQGKSAPTPEFKLSPTDPGTSLTTVSSWADPYATCPYCSKPFVLLLSDPFPSYDSDHLPGSYWPTSISTSDTPSVQTLVANTTMNTLEGIGTVFMGQSGSTNDGLCTPKPGDFRSIRGLCVEEPGKQGSYYIAGLANYARTTDLRSDKTGGQFLTTYGVVTNAPFPTFEYTVGTMKVQVVPAFHDGCPSVNWGKPAFNSGAPGYSGCTSQGTNGDNSGGELVDVKPCPVTNPDADWVTEQGNGFTSCYDLMYDDADYGWDYDLDIRYRIYVKTTSTTITVKTKGIYGNAGHTDYAGYFINGVSGAGQYLDVVCGGIANQTDCDTFDNITSSNDGMGNSATTRTFTVTGSNAGVLKDPLWYAAKYGGFSDKDGNNVPNLQVEWDADNDGVPDTYFYAPDPLKLQNELALAFYSILNKISSGTSVSVLANSSTGDGSLYQAYFFPNQIQGTASIAWTGYVQGLFIDEFGNVREDTDGDGRLIYQNDKIIRLRYDTNLNNVVVDQFLDANGDGTADSSTPTLTVGLTEIAPIWEAGRRLALTAPSSRTILTWVDSNNNGLVDTGEQIPFITTNSATLGPYLRAGAAPYTSTNIINFIRGTQVAGMRNRQLNVTDDSGNQALQVWKLGDPINSTPTVVRAPKERFDLLYGDSTYQAFYQKYKNRREVVYVGANDGMLHAFNGGFYNTGDDPTTTTVVEHGWFSQTVSGSGSGTVLGQELWAFIPYQLLPQVQWLTQTNYTHVYYVDLKPKVTDARIFTPDADHPNGWGTILIGGFRLGGSCGNCVSGSGAPPMTVNISGTNVTFYSGYFVLDITNPEVQPKLLWSYSDANLGLTTSYPSVIRVNPSSASKTDNTNAAWLMVVGTGPTGYDGSSAQTAKILAINLATGPGTGNSLVTTFSSGDGTSFMGDVSTVDVNLDFRVDVVYMGNVICNATGAPCSGSAPPAWVGKLYRLTTGGGSPTLNTWGIASGVNRVPTVLLATFPASGTLKVGPIIAAPSITIDDANRVWLFFGTGRYFSTTDKTNADTQYFFGVKDPVATGGCTESTVTNCQKSNLLNVSSATVCVTCTGGTNQVTGVAGVTTLSGSASTTLEGLIGTMDGWYTTLPTSGERSLAPVTLIGGTVFFTTFVPVTDVCVAAGNGYVYGLFYKTGSAYKDPVIGTYTGAGGAPTNAACSGSSTCANRAMTLGSGLPSQMVLQIGAQGTGASGSTNGAGCTSRVMGFMQSSNAALYQTCVKPALSPWSRYVSWVNQRD